MFQFAADAAPGGASSYTGLWPIVAMFVVFYFLLIRPQQKRTKARNLMLNSMKKGDKVITEGGIHGTIIEMDDENKTIVLRVNESTKLTFERAAVMVIKEPAASNDQK